MSKTAVLLSGQTRSFSACLPTMRHHLFRHLSDPHFFFSVVDDAQAAECHLLEAYFPGKVFVERVVQPDLAIPGEHAPASSNLAESQRHRLSRFAPYAISSHHQAILRQLWHLNRVWEFFDLECRSHPTNSPSADWRGTFDVFVRCRPDLWFQDCVPMDSDGEKENAIAVPYWSACGGINDRFAVMEPAAAADYFTAYTRLAEMLEAGVPLHPESLMKEATKNCATVFIPKCVFSTLRMDGTLVPPREYPGELAAFLAAR